jgi:hypothetical protein
MFVEKNCGFAHRKLKGSPCSERRRFLMMCWRDALRKITEGMGSATASRYVLRVKSFLTYGHKLGYLPFNAGVTIKIKSQRRGGAYGSLLCVSSTSP